MAENPGIHPLDPATLVGQFRLAVGDTQSEPFDPPTPGIENYTQFSDNEILQFLVMGRDSINRAIGYSFLQAAGSAAYQSKQVKDYDLSVDLTKRADDLRKMAQSYFDLADADDLQDGSDSFFDIVPTGNDRGLYTRAEATAYHFPLNGHLPW